MDHLFILSFQVNRELSDLIDSLKQKSEEEAVAAQENTEIDEAEGVDDVGEAEGADDVAEPEGMDDVAEVEGVDDVAAPDEDGEADAEVENLDESEPSDGAVENGNAVISEQVEGEKAVASPNGKIHGSARANGKGAKTKKVEGEKLKTSIKRKGAGEAGNGRALKKAKRVA